MSCCRVSVAHLTRLEVIIMDLDDPLEGGPCYWLYCKARWRPWDRSLGAVFAQAFRWLKIGNKRSTRFKKPLICIILVSMWTLIGVKPMGGFDTGVLRNVQDKAESWWYFGHAGEQLGPGMLIGWCWSKGSSSFWHDDLHIDDDWCNICTLKS